MSIFEPNKIRYILWYLLYYAVVWYVSYIGFQVLSGDEVDLTFLLRTSLVLLFVVFFGIFVWPSSAKSMAIVVSNEIISGPTVWVNRPIRFHLNAINIEKSQQQSIFQRILGYRLIVSGSDEKILFVERVFDKNQVTEILKTIGYADSLAV